MSLQDIANHLAAKGRGPDTTLVHMTEGEVKSLQDIAKAHGGSLTINPQTGLPEAGFLSSILPMVAGFALGPAGFGIASSALGAGLMVGAGNMLLNPNQGIKGALLSGLSGYGGASLGQSLAMEGVKSAGAGAATEAAKTGVTAVPSQSIMHQPFEAVKGGLPANEGFTSFNQLTQAAPVQIAPIAPPVAITDAAAKQTLAGMDAAGRFNAVQQGFTGENLLNFAKANPYTTASMVAAPLLAQEQPGLTPIEKDRDMGQRFSFNANRAEPLPEPDTPGYTNMGNNFGVERSYFRPTYSRISNEEARSLYGYASGGPVEQMSNNAAIGANTMYPMANTRTSAFSSPFQEPISTNMLSQVGDDRVNSMTGESSMQGTRLAGGGIADLQYNLGGYSDGGRLLRGPGDGVSDSIPATIANKQPARLADGEFVVPARIVSELGNGSTEAGARKLYAMMDRVQKARSKTVGEGKVAKNSRADKYLPA